MQILKLAGLFIVSFLASFMIFALVLPSTYSISQFIEIERPKEVVFKTLKNLEDRKVWYSLVDSNIVSSIKITGEGDNGSKFSWSYGEVEVVLADIKKMENNLKFINYPIKAGFTNYLLNTTGKETFDLIESQQRTTVTWTISGGPLDYPIGKVVNAAVKYKIYKEMEKSLFKLKDYIESIQMEETPKDNNPPINPQVQQRQPEQQNSEQQNTETPQN